MLLYFEKVKGLENEKEGGKRCEVCFELRLEQTARLAKEKTLIIFQPHLQSVLIKILKF